MNSNDKNAWPYIPFGLDQIDNLRIDKTEGCYLYTQDGRKILDASAGAAVGNIGWGRPEVAEAVAQSLTRNSYVLPTFITSEREQLVEQLREYWLPKNLTKVSFMGSGSEAVDNAIRLARQYQLASGQSGRWKVIGRDISYHGTSIAGLSVGGHAARRQQFEPMLVDMPHIPACYCLRCPFGKTPDNCQVQCATALETMIEREGADTIAAFIAEPIVGASGGVLVPPEDYWPTIAAICKRHNILLIADEVMTGFGRTGARFAVDHWAVTPDILVLGKGLSGGYATISAVATSEAFCQRLSDAGIQPMYHTYGAHPSACAAATTVLNIMQNEHLLWHVEKMSAYLSQRIKRLEVHPNVAQIRGRGFLFALEIVEDKETLTCFTPASTITARIVSACLRRNCFVYFGGTGAVRDIILIAPHFIATESDIDFMVWAINDALNEVCCA